MAIKALGYIVDDDVQVRLGDEGKTVMLTYLGEEVVVRYEAIPDLITALQKVYNADQ